MSLSPINSKRNITEIKTGGHILMINDMFILRNANKEPIKIEGHTGIVVQFKNGENKTHEQLYIIDGGVKQKYFDNMLRCAQVTREGTTAPKKSDAIGKRLWGFIQEVHYVKDEEVQFNTDGSDMIDYYIFKVYPYIEGVSKPIVKGDPEHGNGIPSDNFVIYKNIVDNFQKDEVPTQKEESVSFIEETKATTIETPSFAGDDEQVVPKAEINKDEEVPNF